MSTTIQSTLNILVSTGSNSGSVRVFKNPVLEWLTHVRPITPALVWIPIISYLYYRAFYYYQLPVVQVAQVGVAAFTFWTLCEYLIHRFVFHWRNQEPIIQMFTHLFHGIHHDRPNDATRLLMPPAGSLLFGCFFYLIFRNVLGAIWADPFFASFAVGYLVYDYTHFSTHFIQPRTSFGRSLKKCHMEHHFISDRTYYGVSSQIWDYVFGTTIKNNELDYVRVSYPEPHFQRTQEIVAKYPKVRNLFGPTPSTGVIIGVLVTVQLAIAYEVRNQPWWVWFLTSYTIGAVANHALFVMIHECSHNLVFRNPWKNKVISIFANFPIIFPSAISFRNYHLAHHRYQGDVLRDADLAVPGEAALIGNSVFGKALWMLFFFIFQTVRVSAVKKVKFLDRWVVVNWIVQIGVLSLLTYYFGWPVFIYLLLSSAFSVGLHPLGARWIQEHFLTNGSQETSSYYGPLNIIAFNVGFHNEHHDLMNISWSRLPQVKEMAPEFYNSLYSHSSWTKLFFRFLFDQKLSLYSRVIRE